MDKTCNHEFDNNRGIQCTNPLQAHCKKCGKWYECDINGKPHLIELLGEKYEKYSFGDREIIKRKE